MCTEEEKLHEFLREIQLEQFYYLVVRNLHVTRLTHFDHVEEIDLTGIGMSKPEQRRLFDHLKKAKRPSLKKLFRVILLIVDLRDHFYHRRFDRSLKNSPTLMHRPGKYAPSLAIINVLIYREHIIMIE